MIIGAPLEIKKDEKKIAMTPDLVNTLTSLGHKVVVQKNFAKTAGFKDTDYKTNGAEIVNTAEEVYSQSDVIVKINPPLSDEYDLLKENQIIFAFFQYTDKNALMETVLEKKITTISYSEIVDSNGAYPIIEAGSEIVGRAIIRECNQVAQKYMGGAMLSGAIGVAPKKITIVGSGVVGKSAAKTAKAIGADVSVLDIDFDALKKVSEELGVKTYFASESNLYELLKDTDFLICAVKENPFEIPVVTADMVAKMKKGRLIIDAGITSGNTVVETLDTVTTLSNPICEKEGMLYFSAPDLASLAANAIAGVVSGILTRYIIPVVSNKDMIYAMMDCKELVSGVMTYNGKITNEKVAEIFNEEVYELSMLTGI